MNPTKLMIVDNFALAKYYQKFYGNDWRIIAFGSSLMGSQFDLIVIAAPPKDQREWQWINEAVMCRKKTKDTPVLETYVRV